MCSCSVAVGSQSAVMMEIGLSMARHCASTASVDAPSPGLMDARMVPFGSQLTRGNVGPFICVAAQ